MLMPLSATKPRSKCAICKYWNGEKPEPPAYGYYIIEKENEGICCCKNSQLCNQHSNAIHSCDNFKIDDQYVDDKLVEYCMNVKRINIPACIDKIDDTHDDIPFSYFENLESITVDENNKNFCSIDGVLFSKDRKTLVKYPPAKHDKEYIIPEGTERISFFAFSNYCFNLEKLRLSESVICVENHKSNGKYAMPKINISGAFDLGKNNNKNFFDKKNPMKIIFISSGAFSADEDNESFHCEKGVLFSKDMKKLIAYPTYKEDAVYYIPYDVESTNRSFFGNAFISEIYVPFSVKEIPYYEFSLCKNLKKIYFDESHFLNKISSISFFDTLKIYEETLKTYEETENKGVNKYECI